MPNKRTKLTPTPTLRTESYHQRDTQVERLVMLAAWQRLAWNHLEAFARNSDPAWQETATALITVGIFLIKHIQDGLLDASDQQTIKEANSLLMTLRENLV